MKKQTSLLTHTLPTVGSNWLDGFFNKYILLSLKHSRPEFTMFWRPGECGYTCNFFEAGIYERDVVIRKLPVYNDCEETIAVPLTQDALHLLGFGVVKADLTFLDKFRTVELPEPK